MISLTFVPLLCNLDPQFRQHIKIVPLFAIPYVTCDLASRLALKITNAPRGGVTFSTFLLFIVFVYFEVEHDYFLVIGGDCYHRLLFKFLE